MATVGVFQGHIMGLYIGTTRIAAMAGVQCSLGAQMVEIHNASTGDMNVVQASRRNASVSGSGHFVFDADYGPKDLIVAWKDATLLRVIVTSPGAADLVYAFDGYIEKLDGDFMDHAASTYTFSIVAAADMPDIAYKDLDGNSYTSVIIGNQEWLVENWKCTKYADGTSIPNIPLAADWIADTGGAYCDYNNDEDNVPVYGRLYNWHAPNHATKSMAKLTKFGFAQEGFDVAADTQWIDLLNYLDGASVAGGKLKATGLTYWADPNTGATNETGFTALASGSRSLISTGVIPFVGGPGEKYWASFWSKTDITPILYGLMNNDIELDRQTGVTKVMGASIRMVRELT